MTKLTKLVGPGTAGVAQRINSNGENYSLKENLKYLEVDSRVLEVLKYHKIMSCGHNQY